MVSLRLVSTIAVILFTGFVMGCQKNEESARQAPAQPTAQSSSASVAQPVNQLPPSDASLASGASGTGAAQGTSGNGNGPTQASEKELGSQQENTAMPLPGQVNNHSTPATTGTQK